ncbi:MAG: hypothetical protein BGP11_19460 [Rhodobacterales bacterium 65-51]|uniref:hypothetical protein n=1 Tax=uncultured Gemmobacter sp. TaxID=1095917 RepID=UPI0009699F66|nr:hypothetical protein [uncultured Gemmobacter sp.]OJY35770.1 MAG: hypothetical protein BGP11_19460 [Rhodobacterales bacterium 65-51]
MTEAVPEAKRATISAVMLTYACPDCGVEVDQQIDATEDDYGCFTVELSERFDLCSHCGQLMDFGASLTQGGGAGGDAPVEPFICWE